MCNQKKLEHFYLVGEKERDVVKEWLLVQKAKNDKEATFVDGISKALVGIDYDYMISGLEPTVESDGEIHYKPGGKVCNWLAGHWWIDLAKDFAPEYDSKLTTLSELWLWYAYRVAMGWWSLEYICNVSRYYCKPQTFVDRYSAYEAKSGMVSIGGARDGTNNTYKITWHNGKFALVGGWRNPVAFYELVPNAGYHEHSLCSGEGGTGVVTLHKIPKF